MGKILVTGATGFTGQNLCRRLTTDGGQVVAFAREAGKTRPLQDMGVECRIVDIKDRRQVFDNFRDIEVVYHTAAAYRTEHADLEEFRQVNVEATRHLLDASKEAGVQRFVHCSTVGVQGGIDHPPADEEYRMLPGDHYQRTKVEGELLAREYFAEGLPGTVVRPVGIYGPGDTRFLKLFRPINRGYFVMIGSGKTLYHMTYIDDLVDGFILCGTHPRALGEVFTIGGETYTTIRDLANHIADVLGKPHPWLRIPFWPVFAASVVCDKLCRALNVSPPIYPRRVEFFQLDRAFSIEKAKRLLGYQPKVDLPEGLKRTTEWYREQGML
ncbi:MAG: NAD-dependent epimerase/dehydratase family protein [Pirellulaceae bacterium]